MLRALVSLRPASSIVTRTARSHIARPTAATAVAPLASLRTAPSASFAKMSSTSSSETPIFEQSIAAMKKYLDSYGVSHADCIEKSEIVARVKQTQANPPAKKPAADADTQGRVGEKIVKLFGDRLQMKTGKFATEKLQARVVAIYFSAHWCGPCRQFTPALKQLYLDSLKKSGVEVVFISADQGESEFNGYYGEMPWLALPFAERETAQELNEQFRVRGIPALIVLDAKTGAVISDDGRRDVMQHKTGVAAHWLSKASKL